MMTSGMKLPITFHIPFQMHVKLKVAASNSMGLLSRHVWDCCASLKQIAVIMAVMLVPKGLLFQQQ